MKSPASNLRCLLTSLTSAASQLLSKPPMSVDSTDFFRPCTPPRIQKSVNAADTRGGWDPMHRWIQVKSRFFRPNERQLALREGTNARSRKSKVVFFLIGKGPFWVFWRATSPRSRKSETGIFQLKRGLLGPHENESSKSQVESRNLRRPKMGVWMF